MPGAPVRGGARAVPPRAFHAALKKGAPAPVYLFSGSETALKQAALAALVDSVPAGVRDFNCDVFHGGEADVTAVIAAAETLPFAAPRRVVILRDIEKARLAGARAEALVRYVAAPSAATVLVITTDEPDPAKSWMKRFAGACTEVAFRPLRDRELRADVTTGLRERGLAIAPDALDLLLETVGGDLGRLRQETEKLSLAFPGGGEIGAAEVGSLVGGYGFLSVFELIDAVCRRDREASLRTLARIGGTLSDMTGLVALLSRRLRILWYLAGGERVPKGFRVLHWQLAGFEREAAAFTRGEIEEALADLGRFDEAAKTSAGPPGLLFEQVVLRLVGS